MGYRANWLVESRVICVVIEGDLNAEVVTGINDAVSKMVETGTTPIHYISDVTQVSDVSVNAFSLPSALEFINSDTMGWNILVGGSQVLKVMANIVAGISRLKFRTAGSVEEALEILRTVDPTLPKTS